jgi:transcriptional regulator with XRE-family HTH domain
MNPKIQYPVGRRIHDLRKRQRITQAELSAWLHAMHAPITRDVIANWETGRSDVPAYCIQIIAYSLGVKVSDILPELTFKGLISGRLMLNAASKMK